MTPPISKSYSSFSLCCICYSVASIGFIYSHYSIVLKKLKNDLASTVLVTTLCCPVFLFFCFFLTYLTQRFLPFHQILVPSDLVGESFLMKNFLVNCLFVIIQFSAKSNTMVKLSVPYSSITEIFYMALSKGSSSGPICSLTKEAFDKTFCQYPGIFLGSKCYLACLIYSSFKYFSKLVSSAS